MKKIVSLFLSLLLVVTLLPSAKVSADDISGIVLEKEMRAMVEQGIIKGYENGKYAPFENVSRGQFATFIARALSLSESTHRFTDVPVTSNLAAGINAAAEAGIVDGYAGGKFGPHDLVTREQMAIMIEKAMDYMMLEKTKGSLNFTDAATLTSSVSRNAVAYSVGLGIISGFPDGNSLAFKPKKNANRAEAAAFIYRLLEAQKKQEEEMTPDPGDETGKPYSVGRLDSEGNVTTIKSFATYAEALKSMTSASTQVISYNGNIIKMKDGSGIVIAKPGAGQSTTVVYDETLKTIHGPIQAGSELQYVTSDETKITIKAAGKIGYIKHSDAYLLTDQQMKGQSYYTKNSSGQLVHSLYNHTTDKVSSYVAGKAPSSFVVGQKYYSWDGSTFTTETGAAAGTFHQYFNMLPARTATNYTADELNAYIMEKLTEREALYKKNPTTYVRYKDATKNSKLIGLGTILKDFERNHKLNALMILGMAIHESDFGMSTHAQKNNNIFGIKVYDSDPTNGEAYASIRDCVSSLSTNYLNKNYVPATGAYANGGMPGNKANGINVRYASDPYWGQKIAGHMYQADTAMGGKDFGKIAIYQTTTEGLNVRSGAGTSFGTLYTYKKAGHAIAKVSSSGDWLKIYSDSTNHDYGYVSSKYAKLLSIAK